MNRRHWLKAALATAAAGCGYSTRPMYPANIGSVYVPMFKTEIFRRSIEFQLTEAVTKKIEQISPYKVLGKAEADTILEGTIRSVRKRVTVQSPFDEPRQLENLILADIEWRNLKTGEILSSGQTPGVATSLTIRGTAEYAPELGQSFATATQEICNRMAQQIVFMMEDAWFSEV